MPPNKRRVQGGKSEHRGRVTVPRDPTDLPRADGQTRASTRKDDDHRGHPTPPASSRYTPRQRSVRLRPGWHKTIGLILVAVGFTIVILNIMMGGGSDLTLLPGGHNELYLFLGLAVAAYSMWWFGWFDREK